MDPPPPERARLTPPPAAAESAEQASSQELLSHTLPTDSTTITIPSREYNATVHHENVTNSPTISSIIPIVESSPATQVVQNVSCPYVKHTCASTEQPTDASSGDDVVTPPTVHLIKSKVHESIAFIEITTLDDERNVDSCSDGTGFRVGDTYMMSAFHVFRALIDSLIGAIISSLCKKQKPEFHDKIKEIYPTGNMTQSSTEEEILRECLNVSGYNTELLLNNLDGFIDKGCKVKLRNDISDIWKNTCKVKFFVHGEFHVDWKIVFGDKDIDVIVLNLQPTVSNQRYPMSVILDRNYSQHDDIQIIRYKDRIQKTITIDKNCIVLDNEPLKTSVQDAIRWWTSNFPNAEVDFFRLQYDSCQHAYDENTGRVIMKSSESFKQGSSGSPVTYLLNQNNEEKVLVKMIFQGGFPPFYYDYKSPIRKSILDKGLVVPNKCFFGRGTTMKKVSQVLDSLGKTELKQKLFAQEITGGPCQIAFTESVIAGADNPILPTRVIDDSELQKLTEEGDYAQADLLLPHREPVKQMNNKGESVLQYVVLYGSTDHLELANTYISANPDLLHTNNKDNESVLHYAARFESHKNVELARLFIEKGAKVNCENKQGESLLHYTAKYAKYHGIELTNLFLEHQALVIAKTNFDKETILHYTAKYSNRNNYQLATIFIDNGAPKTVNREGESLLHYTVKYPVLNKQALAELFIKHGISVNCCNNKGESLTDYIVRYSSNDNVRLAGLFFENGLPFRDCDSE